ncbi:MAG: sensor domain-containing diguanylate cyclase [Campylobacterales bacterium]|nr:sensor domain-containing diguanylate cyclase [Campylobacterales bacterium]
MALQNSVPSVLDFFRQSATAMLVVAPSTGKIMDANDAACVLFCSSSACLCTMTLKEMNPQPPFHTFLDLATASKETGVCVSVSCCCANGTCKEIELRCFFMDTVGEPLFFSVAREVTRETAFKHSLEQLLSPRARPSFYCNKEGDVNVVAVMMDKAWRKEATMRQQLAANVFTYANEGILITDAMGKIVDANGAFVKISGFELDEIIGQTPRLLCSRIHSREFFVAMWETLKVQKHWCGEIWNQHKDGTLYPRLLTISAIEDAQGNVQNYVALYADISHLKAHEQELERAAYYDFLTGLPNRACLMEKLEQAICRAKGKKTLMGVAYIDLDGFKAINDTHGHEVGDEILTIIAKRLQAQLRQGDTLARLGGDEFVAILEELKDSKGYLLSTRRLLEVARKPLHVRGMALELSVSIGVALCPLETHDPQELMRYADRAMYLAKQAGKNRCVRYGLGSATF